MLTLEVENQELENIFSNGFNSDKTKFIEFIIAKYKEDEFYKEFDKSCKEVKAIQKGEVKPQSLEDFIDELKHNSN